jgi:hypothetical protein
MRTIQISTDVFAALWASRRGNEQTEDEILRSLLKVKPPENPDTPAAKTKIGYADPRNGLQFPEGFEVFRNYLGTEFRRVRPRGPGSVPTTTKPTPASMH